MKLFARNPVLNAIFGAFALSAAPEGGGAPVQQYKVVKKVTLPLLSLKEKGRIVHIKITSAIAMGRKLKGDESKKEAAHLCMVTDLDTGEELQMIVPAVLRSTLEEEYPTVGDKIGYLNKCFEIENLGKKTGKGQSAEGYNTFRIVEIEPIDSGSAAGAKGKK